MCVPLSEADVVVSWHVGGALAEAHKVVAGLIALCVCRVLGSTTTTEPHEVVVVSTGPTRNLHPDCNREVYTEVSLCDYDYDVPLAEAMARCTAGRRHRAMRPSTLRHDA